jgi:hypothetical protein
MTMRDWSRLPSTRAALFALVAAFGLVVWTFIRAVRVDALPAAPPASLALGSIERFGERPTAAIQSAVEKNLFSPDREAGAPYRLPGEADPGSHTVAPEPEAPIVVGTAVGPDGRSFATVVVADSSPRMVRVGEKIGEFTVKSIERSRVVFTSTTGKRLDIKALRPGT